MPVEKTVPDSLEGFKAIIASTEKLILVQYSADWCGPCRNIAAHITKNVSSDKVVWIYVDVETDVGEEIQAEYEPDMTSLPTFGWFHKGEHILRHTGGKVDKFTEIYDAFMKE